jgi:serine/threonine protein kinase
VDIYCTRPNCTKPLNSFADLDSGNTLKTISQKFCTACGMPLLLGGRYIVESPIAQGGFGATFLARDRYTPAMKRCVVKLLQPVGLTSSQMVIAKQMFEREATVLEDLGTHPQIPDLLAYFEVQSGQDEFFYLVQEFVDGYTLEKVIEMHGGAIAEADALEIMQSLLPVLTFIHDKGSIHRDIKPANIMVRKLDQTYFLLDFGAVKQVAGAVQGQKSTGIFTPGYGAPEQMRGDTVFPATDLYAFAVTCLFLLTGKEPDELFDVNYNKWQWDRFVQLSPNLNNVLHKMLETAPSDRFTSSADVLQALNSKISVQPAPTAPAQTPPVITPINPAHQTSIQVPVPAPLPNFAPSVPKPVALRSQKTPWILSAPISIQFIGAFLLGVEAMLLWQLSITVGLALIGTPTNLIAFAAVLLGVVGLRISSILDNKDLFVFVNLLSFAAVWGVQTFGKLSQFQSFPNWIEIAQYCGVAGFSAIALMAAFRLIFQLLYSFL